MKKAINKRLVLQFTLFGLGIAMLTVGLLRGEAQEIYEKATVVCLECIGIG